MYVCLCNGVSEANIKRLVDEGHHTMREIQKKCKAGNDCGQCLFELKRVVDETCSKCDEDDAKHA